MGKPSQVDQVKKGKELCPMIGRPEPDCYCSNFEGHNITLSLHYCRGNFRNCNIYQRIVRRMEH